MERFTGTLRMDSLSAVMLRLSLAVWVAMAVLLRLASCSQVPANHHLYESLRHFELLHVRNLQHKLPSIQSLSDIRYDPAVTRELHFSTLGRDFHLKLKPRKQLLHRIVTATIIEDGRSRLHPLPLDQFFDGYVDGEPASLVSAHVHPSTGILTASISSQNERYFVEPSHPHILEPHPFHMISYRATDVKYNLTSSPSDHFCGNSEHQTKPHWTETKPHWTETGARLHGWADMGEREGERRLRRATLPRGNSCPVHLVATHKFHRAYARQDNSEDTISFMLQVIDIIDQFIYQTSRWDAGTGEPLGLIISNITVYTTYNDGTDPPYNADRDWDSSTLLESFSHADWEKHCLAHLFTAVTLTDNRLGIAYIASDIANVAGGICSRRFQQGGVNITANVGVSSLYNRGRPLLLAEAELVTAHEIGHNWGSEHDPTDRAGECNPDLNQGGKYIMFPSQTDGSQPNNYKFSQCTVGMVSRVLRAKANCFMERSDPRFLCGNYIIDVGEDCDAGLNGLLNSDPCCTRDCTFKNGAMCSDINHACCDNCLVAQANQSCRANAPGNSNCYANQTCRGDSKDCPKNEVFVDVNTQCGSNGLCKPNGTMCNTSGVCSFDDNYLSGEHVQCLSFCQLRSLEECFCSGDDECHHCCIQEDPATGLPSCQRHASNQHLPEDSTCLGGFCHSGICDPATQDLVTRLFKLFSDFNIDTLALFLRENIVGSVLFITLLFWVPLAIAVHCFIDVKIWKELQVTALHWEKEKRKADLEDERDIILYEEMAVKSPEVFTPQGRKALFRMASQVEGDFFSLDDPSLLSTDHFDFSPTKSVHTLERGKPRLSKIPEDSPDFDPEKDNILTHMSGRRESDGTAL